MSNINKGEVNTQLDKINKQLIATQVIKNQLAFKEAQSNTNENALTTPQSNDETPETLDNTNSLQNDDDLDLQNIRELRKQQLKNLQHQHQRHMELGGGTYETLNENEFFKVVTTTSRCVCHFYHEDFERCKILDKHLNLIAKQFVETRFFKINAATSPFLISKLAIRVLPTFIIFINGIAAERCIGFSELGNNDAFKTSSLIKLLYKKKGIHKEIYVSGANGDTDSELDD